MARFYQRKYCLDGSINPEWKPDRRKRKRGRNGKRASKWDRGEFVAWDSEGATDAEGRHRSICLLNSAGGELVEPEGIRTGDALRFLCEQLAANASKIHVGFVFSYDVNMILGDLPREMILDLWKIGRVKAKARDGSTFIIRYRPRKEFAVWNWKRDGTKTGGVIWDVFGFFQSSFVGALKSYGANPKVIDRILQMKNQRAEFDAANLRQIVEYCREECAELAALMARVLEYMKDAELKIARWDGAGAVAGALLRREGVKQYMATLPTEIETASRHAYFGGRIECLCFGHDPKTEIWEADIRSAYPTAAKDLPCLACGTWNRITRPTRADLTRFSLVRVRWNLPRHAPFFPFPWRAESDGNVYFPPRGEGWYWTPEIVAALDAWGAGIELMEAFVYTETCDHAPFSFVPRLYALRAEWRAQGKGAEKILKLGLNSLYGKLAQRMGARIKDGKPENPPYYQIAWAGWITSYTRAALHRAGWEVMQRGRLIAFATDAIYATARPNVPEGEQLGEWEIQSHRGATFVQSGVYWCGENSDEKERIRGFDDGALDRAGIVDAWKRGKTQFRARITRFVGMGRALTGDKQWARWRRWHTEPRRLELTPQGKREYMHDEYGRRLFPRRKPHRELIPTQATLPEWEFARQGLLSAPTESPLELAGLAAGVQQEIRREYEVEEV